MPTTAEHGGVQSTTVTQIQGRGRAVIASKSLKAGEIILKDSPVLLYSALPLNPRRGGAVYCSHCFKTLPNPNSPSALPCPLCSSSALFCSPACLSTALQSSHTPWACQTLTRLRNSPPLRTEELQVQARFLVAAYNLSRVSPSDFQRVLGLDGGWSGCQPDADAIFLHSLITSLCDGELTSFFTVEVTAALLAKDRANAFGLMEPFGDKGDRSVRAYGIYPNASFFNHDCLPNACRFDYVDSDSSGAAAANGSVCNTDVVVRLIHDVPQGREICLSYFPVNLKYSERQRRLKEDYGFTCTCDRCNVEANWSDNEEEEEAMEEDKDELMVDEDDGVKEGEGEESDFPHAYFFLRYMCNRENCWGTLAPLPPSNGTPSSVMECNVCGNLKKNDEEGGMDGDDALEEELVV
ncbi:hypothetical protein RHGRI_001925 [Rhododendron griersonianum]|uniref:SET domain-containing protein n=1 Tax=Rhododendron griersonianum TaxID=479676 RepID=A0AAV6LMK5_9ERIC|nr:hypothetical protein RHGRI_001925 [Rhododendron griersonianum]